MPDVGGCCYSLFFSLVFKSMSFEPLPAGAGGHPRMTSLVVMWIWASPAACASLSVLVFGGWGTPLLSEALQMQGKKVVHRVPCGTYCVSVAELLALYVGCQWVARDKTLGLAGTATVACTTTPPHPRLPDGLHRGLTAVVEDPEGSLFQSGHDCGMKPLRGK